ncbi:MAG: response regulator [Lachnospiraceae bacterium]|nr:response regulator [Lachnospiraceae bacterium]
MTFFDVMIIIQVVAAIFALLSIYIFAQQRPSSYQKLLTITSICGFLGVVAYVQELLAVNLEEAFLAARFGYIGKSFAMMLFLLFLAKYCDVPLPKLVVSGLIVYSTLNMMVVLTCKYHSLYYTSVDFVIDGDRRYLVIGKGPLYWLFMVITILTMASFVLIALRTIVKRKGIERRRLVLLCMSGIIPAVALVLNLLPVMKGFDPTPLGILATTMLVSYSVMRYGLLDTMQLAKDNAMDITDKGIIVVDKHKEYVYANAKAKELYPELVDDVEETKSLMEKIFAGVDEDNTSKRNYVKKDSIYELDYSVLKESDEGSYVVNGYMAWIFDITDDYNHKKELERLKIEAEQANAAKTEFLAKMSHEIRTPMNAIMGFADLALDEVENPEAKEYLEYIKSSSVSLLGIINDVLDISKIESGKMEIVPVEYNSMDLFDEVSVIMETQARKKNIEYNTNIDVNIPRRLKGDSKRIREILINVVGNAIKYTNQGRVDFDVELQSKGTKDVVLEIHIRDTGVGIKKDKLDKIFESFEQVGDLENYSVEGTGLGLAISKQLVELMAGSITVTSEYGRGSDFCIILPQEFVEGQGTDGNAKLLGDNYKIHTNKVKVLVVDDNIINLKVERGILEKLNMSVDTAESGKECLELIKRTKYDAIFMDQMMPEMDGVETLNAIREAYTFNRETPVVLVTANAIVGVKEKSMELGFDGYVSKPIIEDELIEVLLKILPTEKLEIRTQDRDGFDGRGYDVKDLSMLSDLAKLGIKTDEGMKYCGGIDFYREILRISADNSQEKREKLESYLETGDFENYTILVHAVKSSLANIGAVELSCRAKELEQAGKEKRYAYIEGNGFEFNENYTRLMDELGKLLDIQNEEETIAGDKTISSARWEDILNKLAYYISELELDVAEELVDEMMTFKLSGEAGELVVGMKEQLQQFDVEGVKVRLNSLASLDSTQALS